eukprot:Rhum_TRINITY_DN19334_c0_g1::Rhum_TRINITY_DN19334_c0_g1_i1::g.169734::m.169734
MVLADPRKHDSVLRQHLCCSWARHVQEVRRNVPNGYVVRLDVICPIALPDLVPLELYTKSFQSAVERSPEMGIPEEEQGGVSQRLQGIRLRIRRVPTAVGLPLVLGAEVHASEDVRRLVIQGRLAGERQPVVRKPLLEVGVALAGAHPTSPLLALRGGGAGVAQAGPLPLRGGEEGVGSGTGEGGRLLLSTRGKERALGVLVPGLLHKLVHSVVLLEDELPTQLVRALRCEEEVGPVRAAAAVRHVGQHHLRPPQHHLHKVGSERVADPRGKAGVRGKRHAILCLALVCRRTPDVDVAGAHRSVVEDGAVEPTVCASEQRLGGARSDRRTLRVDCILALWGGCPLLVLLRLFLRLRLRRRRGSVPRLRSHGGLILNRDPKHSCVRRKQTGCDADQCCPLRRHLAAGRHSRPHTPHVRARRLAEH